jgi:hypothetical protein
LRRVQVNGEVVQLAFSAIVMDIVNKTLVIPAQQLAAETERNTAQKKRARISHDDVDRRAEEAEEEEEEEGAPPASRKPPSTRTGLFCSAGVLGVIEAMARSRAQEKKSKEEKREQAEQDKVESIQKHAAVWEELTTSLRTEETDASALVKFEAMSGPTLKSLMAHLDATGKAPVTATKREKLSRVEAKLPADLQLRLRNARTAALAASQVEQKLEADELTNQLQADSPAQAFRLFSRLKASQLRNVLRYLTSVSLTALTADADLAEKVRESLGQILQQRLSEGERAVAEEVKKKEDKDKQTVMDTTSALSEEEDARAHLLGKHTTVSTLRLLRAHWRLPPLSGANKEVLVTGLLAHDPFMKSLAPAASHVPSEAAEAQSTVATTSRSGRATRPPTPRD